MVKMSDILYIDFEEVVAVYRKMVEKSGGGFSGIRDENGIKSVLGFIQNDDYYPTLEDKLNHLVYSFCASHFFSDGNKRISITLGAYFLLKNGYCFAAHDFMPRLESIIYHVAASHVNKDLLLEIITCIVHEVDYDERLKIKLAYAMKQEACTEQTEGI